MIANRTHIFVLLAIATTLALTGCESAAPSTATNQKSSQPSQKKASPTIVRSKFKGDADSNLVRLLMLDTVQEDLGLSVDQGDKIKEIAKTIRERSHELAAKMREILPSFQPLPSEEFEARQRKLQPAIDDLQSKGKELQTKALAMLTRSQLNRLKQIQLQAGIPALLVRPQMIKALGISQEQSERIRAICDGVNEKLLAAHRTVSTGDRKERRKDVIGFMKDSDRDWEEARKPILDVLTPEQRAMLEKLQGKKIELKWDYDVLVPEDLIF
jgi:hypothetical protein